MAHEILLNHSINYCNHSVEIALKWIQISVSYSNRCLLDAYVSYFLKDRDREIPVEHYLKNQATTDRHNLAIYSCFEQRITINFTLRVNTRFKLGISLTFCGIIAEEIILSLEIYFRWFRNIFDNWENFFLGREIILSDEKYYGSPEIFERIEKTFSSVKQFFLMVENFLVDWELILSIENFFVDREFFVRWEFFVDREFFCRSRNFCVQSLKVLKLDQQTRSNTNLLMFYLSWL